MQACISYSKQNIQCLNSAEVDFGMIVGGRTIFDVCFQRYLDAIRRLKKKPSDCTKLIHKIEDVFFFLIKEAERRTFDTDKILAIPNSTGQTVFHHVSTISEVIAKYILQRDIKVNAIDAKMMIPHFKFPDLSITMMRRGINPYVIAHDGWSEIQRYPFNFKSEESNTLLGKFPKSIYYSLEDIYCGEDCLTDCSSRLSRFYFKNGAFVEMVDSKRIGKGGFGSVFTTEFHGKEVAAKCVKIKKIDERLETKEIESDLQKNIAEYTRQLATSGSGILLPIAIIRQQDTEKDENERWIAFNFNIYIYPKYDCNLYELHENHFTEFTNETLDNIIKQCLTRKS